MYIPDRRRRSRSRERLRYQESTRGERSRRSPDTKRERTSESFHIKAERKFESSELKRERKSLSPDIERAKKFADIKKESKSSRSPEAERKVGCQEKRTIRRLDSPPIKEERTSIEERGVKSSPHDGADDRKRERSRSNETRRARIKVESGDTGYEYIEFNI